MKKIRNITIAVFVLFSWYGCSSKLPEGMPKLYPVSVTITQQGKALAGATVSLVSADAPGPWISGSRTDENGVATIRTHGRYDGAPAGSFKVCVKKIEAEKENVSDDTPRAYFFTVPDFYDDPGKTPLEMEVKPSSNKAAFDISEKIRIPVPAESNARTPSR